MTGRNINNLWLGLVVAVVIFAGIFTYFQFGQRPTLDPRNPGAQANPTKIWEIGVLLWDDDVFVEFGPFKQKMEELGYAEGVEVEYVIKNAQGDIEVAKEHTKELLADEDIDLIAAFNRSYKAFDKSALTGGGLSKPTIFSNVGSFEAMGFSGLYTSTMNFGLNFTGVVCGNVEFSERRMEILKGIIPEAKVFGVLFDMSDTAYERTKKLNQDAAQRLQVELLIIEGDDSEELVERAKREFTKDTVDGVIRTSGPSSKEIADLASHFVETGVPFITWSHTNPAVPDYIAALANDPPDQARQAAAMVHKFISGVAIDDIPIEFARNLEIHLNTAVAEKADIEIPEKMLLEATIINTKP